MKLDTHTTSSSRLSVGATVAPVTETPVVEAPVMEASVAEAPVNETLGAGAPVAPSGTPAPMETGRVGDGQSWAEQMEAGEDEVFQRSRPTKHTRSQSRRCEPKPRFPSPSKTVRGGLPPFHSSTSMWPSSLSPTTMRQVEESCISIQRCCHKRPGTWEIRSPA